MSPIIETKRVTRRLPGEVPVTLVKEIDFAVNPGECVVITGPSGSGKSSLLYLLGLLDQPTEGSVHLLGEDMTQLDDNARSERRLREVGFIFQFHFLLPEFSALENVLVPMQRLGTRPPEEAHLRATSLLESLGLAEHMHKRPRQISGGQSQRVAIARALANEPHLILADEPTGNLDSEAGTVVRSILRSLASKEQRAVVVVTHDPRFLEIADRHVTLVDGKTATN